MLIELVDLGSIHPYERNPRFNDDAVDAVAASIREFGWRQPIVVDGDGLIIAFLMEIDPLYCDVIVQRWEEFAGKKAVRAAGLPKPQEAGQ